MSGGPACINPKVHRAGGHWHIVQFMCNHSAFNGYKYTHSEYSEVHCRECGRFWRTKAGYVHTLPVESLL